MRQLKPQHETELVTRAMNAEGGAPPSRSIGRAKSSLAAALPRIVSENPDHSVVLNSLVQNDSDIEGNSELLCILLIEDDAQTANFVVNGLTQAGHTVKTVSDGQAALSESLLCTYNLLIVSGALANMDGLSIIKQSRIAGVKTPVLFLTSRSFEANRQQWFDAGVDDYLNKPFVYSELLARATSLGKRSHLSDQNHTASVEGLTINFRNQTVKRDNLDITLNSGQYMLLNILMQNVGEIVSYNMLLEQVWGLHFHPKINIVDSHIDRLRHEIDGPFSIQLLHKAGNLGYSLYSPR